MKDTASSLRAQLKSQGQQLETMSAQVEELLLEQAWLRKARKIMRDAGRVDFVTAIGKHVVQGLLPMKSYRCELLENEARNGWRMGSARHGARYSGVFDFVLKIRCCVRESSHVWRAQMRLSRR